MYKNSSWKTAPNAQRESELSFQFAKEVTDSGELLATVPDMADDNLETADDVAVDPHVVAKTDLEDQKLLDSYIGRYCYFSTIIP